MLYSIHTEEEEEEEEEERGYRILVMSSVGRSGSSFLGQLVAQLPNTIYFFEPLHFLQNQSTQGVTSDNSRELLSDIFECRFTEDWVRFSLGRKATLTHLEVEKECARDTGAYLDCVTKLCLSRMNKVIKVIRMRVSWVQDLLNRDASLKVIHIVRDPRGSFASLKSLNMVQKNHREWCPKIQEDLVIAKSLESSFPKSFTSVKYEDLCSDPLGMSLRIWKFLGERNTYSLPDTWKIYLTEHTSGSKRGNFSTQRDSQKEAEAWRQEISEDTLLEVERDCAKVLELLGYNMFGSLIHARNISLSLRRKNKLK
ncbi:carbohydrate sulfotransferase 1-like [Macrobrachium nipponense]|uniref:carbohydrate sulfotransferase 1-like n=1 Tax=Macrobrachium nipponense TaxID=159736 RepID=UPI0030C86851